MRFIANMEGKSGIIKKRKEKNREYLVMDMLEGRIGAYGHVLEMDRKEDPRKALNMKLNENT
jgi:hypothetical protein